MKIVVLDGKILNPGDLEWSALEELGELVVYDETSRRDFAQRVKDADVVLVNKTLVERTDIAALANCKLLGVLATGSNNLDLEGLAKAGIQACNVPGYGVGDVAQHALALIMELVRHTCELSASIKKGEWLARGQWCYWLETPLSLEGLNLGIIGFGAIGQTLGKYGHALGMNIFATARRRNAETSYPFTYVDLEGIWSNADIISLHCPLTPETDRIINAESIAAMRDGVILINTARGALVDEEAVANALISGKMSGFGADVLCHEPPEKDNILLKTPNTLLTPHMAWATARARNRIIEITAENIKAHFKGQTQNAINRPEK